MRPIDLLARYPEGATAAVEKCTLNCPVLDGLLAGGVPCNSITEFVSESGVGKTQICLQLLLSAQFPASLGGLSSSSLFLYSEFPFPLRRLRQLSLSSSFSSHLPPSDVVDPLDRILVHPVHDADHLLDILLKLDTFLSMYQSSTHNQWPIRLIVIDSIAALFRADFDNNPSDLNRRSSLFFKVSGKLRALADKFSLAVVVTNQVMDCLGDDMLSGLKIGNLGRLVSSGRRVSPALGLAWSNCVNTRLFLSRTQEVVGEARGLPNDDDGDGGGGSSVLTRTRRYIHVLLAPHLPSSFCEFQIVREGVFGVQR